MKKEDILNEIIENQSFKKDDVEAIIDSFLKIISKNSNLENSISLSGFEDLLEFRKMNAKIPGTDTTVTVRKSPLLKENLNLLFK